MTWHALSFLVAGRHRLPRGGGRHFETRTQQGRDGGGRNPPVLKDAIHAMDAGPLRAIAESFRARFFPAARCRYSHMRIFYDGEL